MAVISFRENSDAAWVVAGWAFRQVLADVMKLCPKDAEIAAVLEQAEAVGFLRLGCLDPGLAVRLSGVLVMTAADILSGKMKSGVVDHFNDGATTEEYMGGLRMLLDAAQGKE